MNSLMHSDTKEHTNILQSKTIVEQFSGIFFQAINKRFLMGTFWLTPMTPMTPYDPYDPWQERIRTGG